MRALVCGGRDFSDRAFLFRELDLARHIFGLQSVVHGGSRGADQLAGEWAHSHELRVIVFPADWKTYPKIAGFIRNQQMLDEGRPNLTIAFEGGNGTKDMIRRSLAAGVLVWRPGSIP